jgi:hypothetical protein
MHACRAVISHASMVEVIENGAEKMIEAKKTPTAIHCKDWGRGQLLVFSRGWPLNDDAWRRSILSMLVLCSTLSLAAAIANAQEVPASTSNVAGFASGWWSPAKEQSPAASQLLVSMAELTHYDGSYSFRTSRFRPTTYRVSEPMNGRIGLALRARVAEPSLLADRVSPPSRSFSLVQDNYTMWESSLADSRSLINVNGVPVYALLQISYAGWHLPVTLYISSPRDSDAR